MATASPKRLVAIGATGTMLSPSAKHLGGPASPAKVVAVLVRASSKSETKDAWREHGAALCGTIKEVLDVEADALVLCVGKNGDDFPIVAEACKRWAGTGRAILHLSTVSPTFARVAAEFCREKGVRYANYPLTGGPAGAQAATMLMLASGDEQLYKEYLPVLETIGKPRYFGASDERGAEVKLQGQMMVFSGLLGICSAAAVSFAAVGKPVEQSEDVAGFFDFLNGGAGSTRQWDVALKRGVQGGDWSEGFQAQHAAVDALYAADMARNYKLSHASQSSMWVIAASLAFVVQQQASGARVPTHAVAKQLRESAELDKFLAPLWPDLGDPAKSSERVLSMLSSEMKASARIQIAKSDFEGVSAAL